LQQITTNIKITQAVFKIWNKIKNTHDYCSKFKILEPNSPAPHTSHE